MTFRGLTLRIRALLSPRRAARELDEELRFHIDREIHAQLEAGATLEQARARAAARFGSIALAADACRDVRGTAVVDDAARDVLYACRSFRRAPLAAATIVATVALGLGLITVVFTTFNMLVFRVDNVRNPDELFAVEWPPRPGRESRRLTRPEFEALRRETTVFVDTAALMPDITSRIDGRIMEGTLVTGNFFRLLGVDAALGRTLSPSDDDPSSSEPVVVLSHAGWSRLFGNDPGVVGRRLLVSGVECPVVGVMPPGFRGLNIAAPDYWAPMSRVAQFRPMHAGREDVVGIEVVGRLRPGLSRQSALAGLALWASTRADGDSAAGRAAGIRFLPRQGAVRDSVLGALLVFTPLFFAFGLILMIGCANVANLLLARGVSRQREIGIRLSIGASRGRIVRQLLTENLLLALVAAALGLAVSRVLLHGAFMALNATIPVELAEAIRVDVPDADWRVVLFLLLGAVAATLTFGLAPALQATRLELVRVVRGEVTRDARPGRARHVLIGLQVAASTLLLVCAAVFLRSAAAAATVDPGLRTHDTLVVDLASERHRTALVDAIGSHPAVAASAASWPDPFGRPRIGSATAAGRTMSVGYRFVSPEYFDVVGIDVLRGRGFSRSERDSSAAVVVVADRIARELWPGRDAVGGTLHLEADAASATRRSNEPPLLSRAFTIVGVARDVPGFRLAGFQEAGIYIPIDDGEPRTTLTVRVRGNPETARADLLDRLSAIDPNMGQIMTMRTMAGLEEYILGAAFWLALVLGAIAVGLTLSGLFSVLSYLVEQRTREIGVRMALGATTARIAGLVARQTIRPVGVGLLTGAFLAAALAIVLRSLASAAEFANVVHVLDPIAYLLALLSIGVACTPAALLPALRAARINPVATLRQE
jgi:predicted permease